MVERPILFSDPMVRAILDGRKTQTRRIVQPQEAVEPDPDDESIANWVHDHRRPHPCDYSCSRHEFSVCPYGVPGDRLWVKEAWRPRIAHHCCMDTCDCADVVVAYQADGAEVYFPESRIADDWLMPKAAKRGNVSPLFMPRWASRLTLEITEVRVERLQAISEDDARAEGVDQTILGPPQPDGHRIAFAALWDSINGDRASWASNPWTWRIEFRRVEAAQEAA